MDRWMVILGWILLIIMAWQTGVSIYHANAMRTVVGVTALVMALWALGVNQERLDKVNSGHGGQNEDARTPRG